MVLFHQLWAIFFRRLKRPLLCPSIMAHRNLTSKLRILRHNLQVIHRLLARPQSQQQSQPVLYHQRMLASVAKSHPRLRRRNHQNLLTRPPTCLALRQLLRHPQTLPIRNRNLSASTISHWYKRDFSHMTSLTSALSISLVVTARGERLRKLKSRRRRRSLRNSRSAKKRILSARPTSINASKCGLQNKPPFGEYFTTMVEKPLPKAVQAEECKKTTTDMDDSRRHGPTQKSVKPRDLVLGDDTKPPARPINDTPHACEP